MENDNSRMDERRKVPRVRFNLPLQYKNLRNAGGSLTGSLTRDISGGGVSFKTGEFISLACRLVVEIKLPTVDKPIKAISKVAWIRKATSGDQYEMGNQFLEIAKEDKSHIQDFVSRAASASL